MEVIFIWPSYLKMLILLFIYLLWWSTSEEHVDGGTSRFDFRGIVYQSVCSGCRGIRDFPTEPDDGSDATYPKRNASQNCNNGVFKFDLANLEAIFEVDDRMFCRRSYFLQFEQWWHGFYMGFWRWKK